MRRFLAFSALVFMLTSQTQALDPATPAVNAGGVKVFGAAAKSAPGNVCLSPYSIQSALAMTYAGAAGGTADQMRDALGFPADANELASGFQALDRHLQQSAERGGDGAALRVANRLFGAKGFAFRPAFLEVCSGKFGAPLEEVNFEASPAAAAALINTWVESQTENRIRELIPADALDKATTLVLANALYLKMPWAGEFSSAGKIPFHADGGQVATVPAIRATERFGYKKADGLTLVGVPLRGGQFQFVILLPDAARPLPVPTVELLADCAALGVQRVSLTMPKFRLEPPTLPLSSVLQQLGMKAAFDIPRGSADFDGMAPQKPDDYLAISEIFHKTFFALDENGIEAAAATAVVMMRVTSMPSGELVEVVVDRPFLFALQHVPSGVCLFLGRMNNPG